MVERLFNEFKKLCHLDSKLYLYHMNKYRGGETLQPEGRLINSQTQNL